MNSACALAEFARSGGPRRVPLRECCVVALLSGSGVCSRAGAVRRETERVPDPATAVRS